MTIHNRDFHQDDFRLFRDETCKQKYKISLNFNDMYNETVKWRFRVIQDNPNCAKTACRFKYMPVPITPLLCEKP